RGSRMLRQTWEPATIPTISVVAAAATTAAGWILRGVSVYLVSRSLFGTSVDLLLPIAGASALAWVVGVVVPFAPGGLGVREAVGASLMSRFMSLSSGVVILLVSRVQSLLVEIATMGLFVAGDRARDRRRAHDLRTNRGAGAQVAEASMST